MNNRDLEDYNNWMKSNNSFMGKFMKDINAIQLIALVGALFLAWYMFKNDTVNFKWYLIGLGVIILAIIFKRKAKEELEPIPENVIKTIAKIQLEAKIGHDTELPPGSKIIMKLESAMQWQGEWGLAYVPWKWGVGFSVKYPDGLIKDFLCILHPYKGYITAIKPLPYGWDPKILTDLKVLMPSMFKQEGAPGSSGLSVAKA